MTPYEARLALYKSQYKRGLPPDVRCVLDQCAFVSAVCEPFERVLGDVRDVATVRCIKEAVAPTSPRLRKFFKQSRKNPKGP